MVQMVWYSGGTSKLRLPVALLASALLLTPVSFAGPEPEAEVYTEILNKYLDATRTQKDMLRGVQMEVDIDATLPKLEKRGTMRVLRSMSRLGQISFRMLGFTGDNTIKKEVITRYLDAEREARDNGSIAITPANYKFHYKGVTERDGRQVASFQITPRKKVVGLFKGELWLDVATGMPLRETGSFVKNPSVFLKKIQFVREYEIRDGVAFPKHIESTVDTRLVGRAELNIEFSNFTREDPTADDDLSVASSAQSNGAQ
jgi:hypothetical protein